MLFDADDNFGHLTTSKYLPDLISPTSFWILTCRSRTECIPAARSIRPCRGAAFPG
jgi:hypothetical protein